MATGAGGVSFLQNLPPNQFAMNPPLFNQSTERQDIPLPVQTFSGLGGNLELRLPSVGVVSLIKLWFKLTLKTKNWTNGTMVLNPGFPFIVPWRVAFNANGQTSLIACRGTVLRARRNRIFRNPGETLTESPGPGALVKNTSYTVNFMIDIPVSHDMFSGIGWVLAQNPATYLSIAVAYATESQICATTEEGGVSEFTGSVYPELTTFAVGQANVGGTSKTVIPDLTVFHGILDNQFPFAANGVVQAPLIRTAGQLVYYAFNLNNNGVSQISPFALSEISFRYGGNRQPRVYKPVSFLVDKNQQDYNGVININGLSFTYLDFEVDQPVRDLFIPEALVELNAQVEIPATISVSSGAYLHYVEESLYPAV